MQNTVWYPHCPILKISVARPSTIAVHAARVITPPIIPWSHISIIARLEWQIRLRYPPCLILKMSVNNCWSCIMGNMGLNNFQTVINEVLAAFISKREIETLPAPSWKCGSTNVGLPSWWITARCGRYGLYPSFDPLLSTKRRNHILWLLCTRTNLLLSHRMCPKYPVSVTAQKGTKILGDKSRKDIEGVEGIVLRKGGDVGRRGGSGEMVAV